MKTTENPTTLTLNSIETAGQQKSAFTSLEPIARPLRSLRPMKSMARIKSIKPTRIEVSLQKRKFAKGH